jgi:diaminopimelate decarboxylase
VTGTPYTNAPFLVFKTAILDISFTCHMPDCLEMPYKPVILGATDERAGKPTYREEVGV